VPWHIPLAVDRVVNACSAPFLFMSETKPPTAPQDGSLWRVALLALKGHHLDYTSEKLNRAVILLAVPMVLEMVMESLFAVADAFWVSHLGQDAIAIVGITESLMTILYAVAIGISIAATAIVSRRIGEKEPEKASQAAGQILLVGVGVSILMGLLMGGFAPHILRLMQTNEATIEAGTTFSRVMLGGNITVFLIFLINAVFRGAGDAVIAMRTLWLANAINIVLAPCFIFGWGPFPQMGVVGAAVGTNIGRGIGVIYQIYHLTSGKHRVHVGWRHLKPDFALIRSVAQTASTGIAQLLISTTSWVGLFTILNTFGKAAVGGYAISVRVVLFALLPVWGLANAAATLVGQNLGAGKPDRAEAAVWIATRYNTIFLSMIGFVFVVFATPIVRLFPADAEVTTHAARALWIVGLGFPLYAIGMTVTSAFNGAGDTRTPTWLNFFSFWCCEIPLAWVLSKPLGLGPTGVFMAIPIAFTIMTVASVVLFRKGYWKAKRV
jgi:putative MATE family efflux protein